MHGFEERFVDLPDYILKITREIWEGRQVDSLYRYYTDDLVVRSPSGVVVGNKAVIDATNATLAEFPDRQLLGEDVIFSDDPHEGYLSSHRILSTATHLGTGHFGPPTGTKLVYRVIADCAVRENRIFDEWLVRDFGAIVRQMGHEPRDFAADLVRAERAAGLSPDPMGDVEAAPLFYRGMGNDSPAGLQYRDALLAHFAGGGESAIEANYDRAVQGEVPGGFIHHGWTGVAEFWGSVVASFPAAKVRVDHCIGRDDAMRGTRAAVRFTLTGRHSGVGYFGDPTGAEVCILVICHADMGPDGVRREFVLFDEVAVWQQILRHAGPDSVAPLRS